MTQYKGTFISEEIWNDHLELRRIIKEREEKDPDFKNRPRMITTEEADKILMRGGSLENTRILEINNWGRKAHGERQHDRVPGVSKVLLDRLRVHEKPGGSD